MKLIISDIKFIVRKPLLLTALLSPVLFTLFLLYIFPSISGLTRQEKAFAFGQYYSVTAITLISAIPFIYGILFSFVHLYKPPLSANDQTGISDKELKSLLYSRIAVGAFISFIMVLPVICITGAVNTEGWLRSIYAAFLLTLMASFIFLFTACFGRNRKKWKLISLISVIFLITVPTGLLIHHPWNYFEFFSPFYWLSWAWVIASPSESMLYGMISVALTAIFSLICFRFIFKK